MLYSFQCNVESMREYRSRAVPRCLFVLRGLGLEPVVSDAGYLVYTRKGDGAALVADLWSDDGALVLVNGDREGARGYHRKIREIVF